MSEPTPIEGPSGFGYPHFRTIAMCVPWSDRHLPPELPIAFRNCAPPMNTNAVYLETHKKPIADARNHFVEKALEFNAKYIFFWDEDVLVPPHALRELIYVADNWPKVGIVSGVYCLKVPRPEPLVFMKMGAGPYWDWKVGEVFEVQGGTGMGCTLLRTEMFKEISKPWFRTVDDNSAYMDNIPRAEAWTEDLWLCNKVKKETKWKIIVHGGLCLPHYDLATKLYYELPPDSKPMRHILLPQGQKKILDVGCGTNHYKTSEGRVVTFDCRDDVGADYRGDCRKLPFATESMDVVHCMAEGSPVLTREGFKKIEEVLIGDEVWTHKRRWRKVTDNTQFPSRGRLWKIISASNRSGILVTDEHPLLVRDYPTTNDRGFSKNIYQEAANGRNEFVCAENISRHHLSIAHIPSHIDTSETIDLARILPQSFTVEEYSKIMSNRLICEQRSYGDRSISAEYGRTRTQIRGWIYHEKKPFGYYSTEDEIFYHSAKADRTLPRFITIDGDLLRLIGYYLADGSLSRDTTHHVSFHFNAKEQNYIDDVQSIILDKFGIAPTDIRQPDNKKAINLRYTSEPLHNIITGMIGPGGALDKKIPAWALWLRPELQMELIEGLLRGDGSHYRDNGKDIATVSWNLAEGIRFILQRNGIMANLFRWDYEQKAQGSRFRGCGWIYRVKWQESREKQKGGLIVDGYLVSRIWSNESIPVDLPVYGLAVEEDESYFASGLMHHNSSHLLEHLPRAETLTVLQEWARVLKPDGELRMLLPNLEWACKQIAAGEYGIMKTTNVCPMDVIYAQQQYPEDFHQTGFTPKLITDLLKQAGFKTIKLDTPLYHIRITASRLEEKNAKPKPKGKKKVP